MLLVKESFSRLSHDTLHYLYICNTIFLMSMNVDKNHIYQVILLNSLWLKTLYDFGLRRGLKLCFAEFCVFLGLGRELKSNTVLLIIHRSSMMHCCRSILVFYFMVLVCSQAKKQFPKKKTKQVILS